MNITAQFSQVRDRAKRAAGEVRINFAIVVEASATEALLLQHMPFVVTTTPCPVKLFHYPNKTWVTAATNRTATIAGETRTIEAFVKAMMPIRSWVQDPFLRFAVPGITDFGYIAPTEHARLSGWLNEEFAKLTESLTAELRVHQDLASDHDYAGVSRATSGTLPAVATPTVRASRPVVAKVGRIVLLNDE